MSKIKNYKTLPVVIEAVQLIEENINFLIDWADMQTSFINPGTKYQKTQFFVETLEGIMEAQIGDYIIKGLRGEFYPCKEDVFIKKYKEIE